jgi:hypothetical protein
VFAAINKTDINAIIITPAIIAKVLKPPKSVIIKMIHTTIPICIALYFMQGESPAG